MRRMALVLLIFTIALLPLAAADDLPRFPSATVKLVGVIQPRDLQIIITNEQGVELTAEDALMEFEFPPLEQWEVSQSLRFSYSSHLAKRKTGKLSFQIEDINQGKADSLRISLELRADDRNTVVENGNTFNTTFLEGLQDKTEMGTLTVKIRKRAEDIYSAGTYGGAFLMSYTEGN